MHAYVHFADALQGVTSELVGYNNDRYHFWASVPLQS
ncbi:hypothetical protein FBY35_1078 [Streptomyces sp. SLBN-118]|nr:hypothetical protein FBY35_1078 [Streptomyces sp. SLBN-118]